MTSLIKIIVTSILSLFLFSCNLNFTNQLDGKGEVTTVEHELKSFNQVDVSNSWNVILIKSNAPKLVVTANENLHEVLEFAVKNNLLTITSKQNIGSADAKKIKVFYTGTLQKVAAHSGSSITSDEFFEQEDIKIDASSGSEISVHIETKIAEANASSGAEIKLTGATQQFTSKASSGSEIDAKTLKSQTATADASSGAEITLAVSKKFTGEASSGGEVNYFGNPESVSVNNSVSGEVNKR